MKEAEAVASREERKRNQTETLKAMFVLYFRVLKKSSNSPIIGSVLEGVAKFSHLINVDFQHDLLNVLKHLLNPSSSNPLSIHSALQCIVTAFKTLRSHGEVLNVDLKDFYTGFYAIILQLTETSIETYIPLVIECLQLMLYDRKQISLERASAFSQRMAILAMNTSPQAALGVLAVLKGLLIKNPKLQQLLDSDRPVSGRFDTELEDPDHCNALSSTLWELGALKFHYHPFVAKFAKVLSSLEQDSNALNSLIPPQVTPLELFKNYNVPWCDFKPALQQPKPHVLEQQLKKAMNSNNPKKREKIYFVRPAQDFPPSKFYTSMKQLEETVLTEVESQKAFGQLFEETLKYENELRLQRWREHIEVARKQWLESKSKTKTKSIQANKQGTKKHH